MIAQAYSCGELSCICDVTKTNNTSYYLRYTFKSDTLINL